ncbi:insulin-like growth factor-binding protein 7 [Danio aesculapii]|uniref:insulin-like growth factor-binding protein 7 n=1 Tax=Danio aesculapii TaxID=1142201 RepID=UPI0024BF4E0D|nr:insulin-like growth factor-binding protein 7 [Danio aesculapii]
MLCVLVLALLGSASAQRLSRGCGSCDRTQCAPLPAQGCSSGTLRDSCGCCELCAAGEGEPCGGRGVSARRCGSGLECVKTDKKSKSGICVCKSGVPVCGTDGLNYNSGCALRAASARALQEKQPEIRVHNTGRCAQGPEIVTPPGEVWNISGSQVFLSCEAIGVPTPVLTWRKVSGGSERPVPLPGDKDNLAVQTRGGPEKHQVTGWVLISPLTKAEDGSYECHASNTQGEASAVGSIHVVESISDIPVQTVKDSEL